MIINNVVYLDGSRCAVPESLAVTFETMASTGGMGWIGLYHPSDAEVQQVADEFSLHPLVIEDMVGAHQRPKIERYDEILFTVLRPARYIDATETVEFGELHVLTGPNWVITSRFAETPDLAVVRRRLESTPQMLREGPEAVLYAILDQVVDEYEPVVDGVANDIDEIEIQVFDGDPKVSKRIYQLLREVIEFQRATQPLRPMLESIRAGFVKYKVDEDLQRYLRDVDDHIIKIIERVDSFRTLLESILTVNATLLGQRQTEAQFAQSEEVKKISSWAAIFFAPSLVAGIYGMNFDHMPELHWYLGYPFALLLMIGGMAVLYRVFKHNNWL